MVQTFNHVKEAFPSASSTSSLIVVIKAEDEPRRRPCRPGWRSSSTVAEHPEQLPSKPEAIDVNPDRTVGTVRAEIAGNGTDDESNRALEVLRGDVVDPTLGSVMAWRPTSAAARRTMPTSRTL